MRMKSESCNEFAEFAVKGALETAQYSLFILVILILIHLDPAFDKFLFLLLFAQPSLIYLNPLIRVLYMHIHV